MLAAAICWFIITVVLLTLPGSALPSENWMQKIWFDKWAHIGVFGLLVLLWCYYFKLAGPQGKLVSICLIVTVLGIILGTAMEFVQKYWIPNRSFDLGDIAADAIGSIMAFGWSYKRFIKK